MADFRPAPFRDLVTRLHREPLVQNALFGLHQRHWRRPDPDEPDTGVFFGDERVGAPCGPAAGPHTQLAQGILLSYVAGGRVMELKSVHDQGRGRVPNAAASFLEPDVWIDWALPVSLADAVCEYVAGAMLIEMFRRNHGLFGGENEGMSGSWAFEVGVGYDLAGISRAGVRGFLDEIAQAGAVVSRLRSEIPHEFPEGREHAYPTRVARAVSLSVCRDVSADEIEKIGELLIGQHGLDLSLRLDAGLLGAEKLEALLCGELGYADMRFDAEVFEAGLSMREASALCRRLRTSALRRGRHFRVKFGGPLEVLRPGGERAWLTGPPLHAATLIAAAEICGRLDPLVPIALVGGVERENFPEAAACGFVPAAACTDLLPARYERLGGYMDELIERMRGCGALDMNEYILKRFDAEKSARRRARRKLGARASAAEIERLAAALAARDNLVEVAARTLENPRYRADRVREVATVVVPAAPEDLSPCPNAAMFTVPTPLVTFDYRDESVSAEGARPCAEPRLFVIDCPTQLAYCAEYCNECGFCKKDERGGGLFRGEKPRFYRSVEAWLADEPRDGYVVHEQPEGGWIRARLAGRLYQLSFVRLAQQYVFDDGTAEAVLTAWHEVVCARLLRPVEGEHRLDMRIYHLLRYLREGVVDERGVNPINVQWMACRRAASGAPRRA